MLATRCLLVVTIVLRSAWDLIRQTYPDLDVATKQAVESHLCQFDPI